MKVGRDSAEKIPCDEKNDDRNAKDACRLVAGSEYEANNRYYGCSAPRDGKKRITAELIANGECNEISGAS